MKKTQKQKVLEVLQKAEGEWVSTRYFKQQMLISEINARLTNLKDDGHVIETSPFRDEYGFAFHRLKQPDPVQVAMFDETVQPV